MPTISASAAKAFLPLMLVASSLPALSSDVSSPSTGISKVRIVRLSEVKGEVKVDLNNGHGFEDAMPNLPIVEQMRLQTGSGVAEVEFEDNSTLRLAPNSLVEFPRLELLASGAKASSVHVVNGMVYVSLVKTPGNDFSLLFGQQKLELPPSSHIRLEIEPLVARLAVLEGSVQIDGPAGPADVLKKKTVTFALTGAAQPEVSKSVASTDYDSWDHDAADYHKRFASLSALNGSSNGYGVSDMMYYGNFSDAGGCGSMWHPYFASASWEPFSNGAWAYYQGAGYSWVSPYPWGWTPYHSGSWAFCPGAGWGWQPGGNWNGLNNVPIASLGHLPGPPIKLPLRGEPSLVVVNSRPLSASALVSEDSFVFRKDSAGLGVPRGTLGNLTKLSQHTIQHGSATTPIYSSLSASSGERGGGVGQLRATSGFTAVSSIHRGYAPPSASSTQGWGISAASGGPSQSSSMSASTSSMHAGASSGSSHPH